ncbi:MAG: CDP-glycerol glycerophosphotransferase family protein [Lachnospiraceae bacterium]|nr:CDP-glycerol glycerophosphotransferase family protein [Lachnospiraceae bacterium]
MKAEDKYIKKRLRKSVIQSVLFYAFRLFPVNKKKIVFCNIEGTVGYGCNPKYICEEFRKRNEILRKNHQKTYDLVWLVDDVTKPFPGDVRVVRNTLLNRAFELTTAGTWVDNSRKQLECRKRRNQFYIQTFHADLMIKPIGLLRGASFSRIAYLVSKHDSELADLVLTDSDWQERIVVKKGLVYEGSTMRLGSPRDDILINRDNDLRIRIREKYHLDRDTKIMMYAPTFRSGSQSTDRQIEKNNQMPDFESLSKALEKRFGGEWFIFLRLHPQLTARKISAGKQMYTNVIDVSGEDDMFETLAACDAFLSDYSASSFDASFMKIPVFLYVYDLEDYIDERGKLLWNLDDLPFLYARTDEELAQKIIEFNETGYRERLDQLFKEIELKEDGKASVRVADVIEERAGSV